MIFRLVTFSLCMLFLTSCTVHREAVQKAEMPPMDQDQDGILDANDRCPTEQETFNGYKDADGCPDAIPNIQFPTIHYGVNSSDRPADAKAELAATAELLTRYPGLRVRIDGHTDSYGSESYNLDISKRRAESVKRALVKTYGVDAGRIETAGWGMSRPIGSFDTKDGRIAIRRIEFVIIDGWPPAE